MSNRARTLTKTQIKELFPQIAERYVLSGGKPIGEASGFGAVWRAHDKWLGREIALKFSDSDMSDELQISRDIEGQTVRIFDYFRAKDEWNAYAMELLESPWISLSQFINKHKYKPNDLQHYFDCFEIARSVLSGLTQIHGRPYSRNGRFVHADIKPDNLFLMLKPKKHPYSVFRMPAEREMVKIIDMGLSTATGDFLPGCTPHYSPPAASTARAGIDLYALGISFLESLTGIYPGHHTMGHKSRIRAFIAGHSSGSAFIDKLTVDFANHCARAAARPIVGAHKLLENLEENIFSIEPTLLIAIRAINKKVAIGLNKENLAHFLFETFAVQYGWRNRTELRIDYIKAVLTDMYEMGLLVRRGHKYCAC